jgi:uncharacterized cupin superfamily protein
MTQGLLKMPSLTEAEPKMERWPDMDPKDLASAQPVQRGINVFDSPDGKLSVGIWACTPMVTTMAPYSVDEFMLVLKGSTTILHEDGTRASFRAGEAFVIAKGTHCVWEQNEDIVKYYAILADPEARPAPDAAKGHAIRLSPTSADMSALAHDDPKIFEGTPPQQAAREDFANATGRMTAGLWTTTPMRRRARKAATTELMCILEGTGTLSDGKANALDFRAGESLLVAQGASNALACSAPVKKFYCTYEAG